MASQRFLTLAAWLVLGGIAIAVRIDEVTSATQLVTTGVPVSLMLGVASLIGLVVSVIIFRTPHDGTTEL